MTILPSDAHEELRIVRLDLFRGQVVFESLRGLELGVVNVALLNQIVSRLGLPLVREEEAGSGDHGAEEMNTAHKGRMQWYPWQFAADSQVGLRSVARTYFLELSSTNLPALSNAASLRGRPTNSMLPR